MSSCVDRNQGNIWWWCWKKSKIPLIFGVEIYEDQSGIRTNFGVGFTYLENMVGLLGAISHAQSSLIMEANSVVLIPPPTPFEPKNLMVGVRFCLKISGRNLVFKDVKHKCMSSATKVTRSIRVTQMGSTNITI